MFVRHDRLVRWVAACLWKQRVTVPCSVSLGRDNGSNARCGRRVHTLFFWGCSNEERSNLTPKTRLLRKNVRAKPDAIVGVGCTFSSQPSYIPRAHEDPQPLQLRSFSCNTIYHTLYHTAVYTILYTMRYTIHTQYRWNPIICDLTLFVRYLTHGGDHC